MEEIKVGTILRNDSENDVWKYGMVIRDDSCYVECLYLGTFDSKFHTITICKDIINSVENGVVFTVAYNIRIVYELKELFKNMEGDYNTENLQETEETSPSLVEVVNNLKEKMDRFINGEEKKIEPAEPTVDIHKIIDDAMEKKDRRVNIFISESGTSIDVSPYEAEEDPVWIESGSAYFCPECGFRASYPTPYCPGCGKRIKPPFIKDVKNMSSVKGE